MSPSLALFWLLPYVVLSVLTNLTLGVNVNSDEDDSKIVIIGPQAKIEELPWSVRIEMISSKGTSLCSGSIISTEYVLTAAHCVENTLPIAVTIKGGFDHLKNATQKPIEKKASAFQVHPDYWPSRISKYDIALIMVDSPWNFTEKVQALELDNSPWLPNEQGNRSCLASGWGTISKGIPTEFLRKIVVTAMHGEKKCPCMKMFVQRRLICIKEFGQSICPGDSGSALVCNRKGVGVAHAMYSSSSCKLLGWGYKTLACDQSDVVSSYMFICPYLDWIRRYVTSVPPQPPSCSALVLKSMVFLNFSLWAITQINGLL